MRLDLLPCPYRFFRNPCDSFFSKNNQCNLVFMVLFPKFGGCATVPYGKETETSLAIRGSSSSISGICHFGSSSNCVKRISGNTNVFSFNKAVVSLSRDCTFEYPIFGEIMSFSMQGVTGID